MNWRGIVNSTHQALGKSRLAVQIAVLLRNQSNCVIQYYLSENKNFKENGELWLVQMIAPKSSTFVDVGANIGNWISLCLELRCKDRKALLFEPSTSAIRRLKQRFAEVSDVEIIESAVADTFGEMSFYEEAEAGETSSLIIGGSDPSATCRVVKVSTLDMEIEKRQWKQVDFLKIDAEGYDLKVLKGASGLLSEHKVGIIQFEYGYTWSLTGSTLAEAFNLFKSYNYQVFLLKSTGLFELNYKQYGEYFTYSNFVAISPQKILEMQPYIISVI